MLPNDREALSLILSTFLPPIIFLKYPFIEVKIIHLVERIALVVLPRAVRGTKSPSQGTYKDYAFPTSALCAGLFLGLKLVNLVVDLFVNVFFSWKHTRLNYRPHKFRVKC